MREALRAQGVLAVDLFGEHDDWAGTDGTFLSRDEVGALLEGYEVLASTEKERDGRSFSGPKHWHTFRILARRLGRRPPPGLTASRPPCARGRCPPAPAGPDP